MAGYRADGEQARERQMALLLTLESASANAPLTQEYLVSTLMVDEYPVKKRPRKVLAYAGDEATVRQKFERDKKDIRLAGHQIRTAKTADEEIGYWVDPLDHYAPPIAFTDEEERYVAVALNYCSFGDDGVARVWSDVPARRGGLETSFALGLTLRAIAQGRALSFDYRATKSTKNRTIAPIVIKYHEGHLYLVGRDKDEAIKGFRLSRFDGTPEILDEYVSISDADRELAARWEPRFSPATGDLELTISTNETVAVFIGRRFPAAKTTTTASGRVEMTLTFDALREAMRFVLEMGDQVVLVGPKDLRKDLQLWLRQVNIGPEVSLRGVSFSGAANLNRVGVTLQLLQAIHAAPEGLRISDLARRFSMPEPQVRDIIERLYTMETSASTQDWDEHYAARITRMWNDDDDDPIYESDLGAIDLGDSDRRLTWNDLTEIAVALHEASMVFDNAALRSALEKIQQVIRGGIALSESLDRPLLHELRAAIDAHASLKISYLKPVGNEESVRVIEPRELQVLGGYTYLRAWCQSSAGWRNFRVDRILAIHATSPLEGTPRVDDDPDWLTRVGRDGATVTVAVHPETRWLFETLPGAQWGRNADRIDFVAFHVIDPSFLDRLMLQAGPGAWVVDGPDWAVSAGRALAGRIAKSL